MDELLGEFLSETVESLDNLDQLLINLESAPDDSEIVGQIFRILHTIKGTCGFLGFDRLQHLSHAGENVLGKVRDGSLDATPEIISLLLVVLDRLKIIVSSIEQSQKEAEGSDEDLVDQLNIIYNGVQENSGQQVAPEGEKPDQVADQQSSSTNNNSSDGPNEPIISPDDLKQLQELDALIAQRNKELREQQGQEQTATIQEPAKVDNVKESQTPSQKEESKSAPEKDKSDKNKAAAPAASASAVQSIRVNVDTLENLMTLVSELVLTRNQLIQLAKNSDDASIMNSILSLSHITSELQEGVMKTRMQPISNAWAQIPRLVRDLSQDLSKPIELIQLGGDTELDRQVLELIRDPLIHMIRNAADHGLEGSEEERIKVGKPVAGRITLNAYHEGGHIIIEISDDGKGIDPEKVKKKIIEKELATQNAVDTMSEGQILHFIFKAGFSTAAKVTNVSGRGVGMDVVRSNIEKLGGSIDLQSKVGIGTRFFIKIPLTLSIISALIIECGKDRFAIPQINVDELVRVGGSSEYVIEKIDSVPFIRLRGHLLPLISLSELLGYDTPESNSLDEFIKARNERIRLSQLKGIEKNTNNSNETPENGEPLDEFSSSTSTDKAGKSKVSVSTEKYIVVSNAGNTPFGVMVDQVYDTQEIVVKPLSKLVRHSAFFSGATILGDGRVVMILDPIGIANSLGDLSIGATVIDARGQQDYGVESEMIQLLLFNIGQETKAVPLALVTRIDEINPKKIEKIQQISLIQYRGQLLPLILFPEIDLSQESLSILIFTDRGRSIGMVVSEIVDVVEVGLDLQLRSTVPGILGSAIISNRSTSIIDCEYYLRKALNEWFSLSKDDKSPRSRGRLLLVDDSQFFRNLITPMLSVAGYQVDTAPDGAEGLKMLNGTTKFDAIVSDIEMPVMNGYEFVSRVRADDKYAGIPIIAISGKEEGQDVQKCIDSGFNHFINKTDQQALLQLLSDIVRTTGGRVSSSRNKESSGSKNSAPPPA